jgi:hypothetical protein
MSVPIISADVAFASAGAQKVPLLQGVTSILGATNSLQAVATAQLRCPYMVAVQIGGVTQFWTAKGGTDATDVANGICQAGDYAETGIVWYQSNPG